jgi:ketosteroid isomerase-like protein
MIAIFLAAASVSGPQCSGVPLKQMIADYAELTRKQDAPAIAHLFGTDGIVDNPGAKPIRGETAIDALLSGFKGFVVTSETMTVEEMNQHARAWHVTGRFHQTGRTPKAKDYDVSGSFDSSWACGRDGWQVQRMATGK